MSSLLAASMNKRIKTDLRRSELITKPQYGDKRPADSTRWMSSQCSGFGQFILISMATTLMLDEGREKLAVELGRMISHLLTP